MITVISTLMPMFCTIIWYRIASGTVNSTRPIRIHFIGRSCSVCDSTFAEPARVAARPLLMPDESELRIEIRAQMPPTSIAPTPR